MRDNNRIWDGSRTGAIVFDFDKTLSPIYMQGPVFNQLGVDELAFWSKINAEARMFSQDLQVPANHELSYLYGLIRTQGFVALDLKSIGSSIPLYPGVESLFERLSNIPNIEIYVVSSGIREMILGTSIAKYCKGVFGCVLSEDKKQIVSVVTPADKCLVLDSISRGSNVLGFDYYPPVGQDSDRRIQFQDMVYVGDGMSDVPAFTMLKNNGGDTWGVFNPAEPAQLDQLENIRRDGRLSGLGSTDYRTTSSTGIWLLRRMLEISNDIGDQTIDKLEEIRLKCGDKVPHFIHNGKKIE